jgi:VanZ family protein
MKKNPWLPIILVSALIFVLTSIPKIPTPPHKIHFLDKVAHFLIYLLWGYTLSRIWNHRGVLAKPFIISALLSLLLFPAIDETHQFMIPGRNASLLDWACDVAGAIIGFSLFARWKRIRDS